MSSTDWAKVPAATHYLGAGEGIPVFFRMLEDGRITDVWGAESDFHFAYVPTDTQPSLGNLPNATRRPSTAPAKLGELTAQERVVLDKLAAAWNAYLELSKAHPDQDAEFRHGIHTLQHQIMARPTRRMLLSETES